MAEELIIDGFIPDLFKMASVIVLPYLFSPSASGSLSLAMGYGKPIIASKNRVLRRNFRSSMQLSSIPSLIKSVK